MFDSVELAADVRRVTFPLPTRPGHVNAYLLRDGDGWTLVDTGLALPDVDERLERLVAALDAPIVRIVITHMHPDHVGAGEAAASATGASVWQGELDYEQCARVWGNPAWPQRVADWFRANGVPTSITDDLLEQGPVFASFIRFARDPRPLREGDRIAGWEVLELPGHADGHLCLRKGDRLVCGDHLLPGISPAVGLYPESRPDPLGDFLASLERTIALAPAVAYPGHGEPLADPVGRAHQLIAHHDERLRATERALSDRARTGYEVSLALFGADLEPTSRRFAVAESLSHLEHLVSLEQARREGGDDPISYTSA